MCVCVCVCVGIGRRIKRFDREIFGTTVLAVHGSGRVYPASGGSRSTPFVMDSGCWHLYRAH